MSKKNSKMQLTKEIFDRIGAGEIFRIVITRLQNIHEPLKETLKFVCVKGNSGLDWAIYCGNPFNHDDDVARQGDKIFQKVNITNICPCDDEVLALYRI